MQFITDLGDQAVILPLIVVVLGILLLLGERRAALWWLLSVGLALGTTFVAKLVFIPCGHLFPAFDVRSPSGHAASATAAYGGIAMLVVQASRSPIARATALCSALAIVLAISATRVLLQAHSVMETVIGTAIGCASPMLLMVPERLFRQCAARGRYFILLAPIIVIPMVLGYRLPAESWINATSFSLAHLIGACGQ